MSPKNLVLQITLLLCFSALKAQTDNSLKKNIQVINSAIKQIDSVFKKKDKKENKSDSSHPTKGSEIKDDQMATKEGDVAPDVVKLDADELYGFNGGAAIIRKGNSTALINAKGQFIVPYNKYRFLYPLEGYKYLNSKSTGLFVTEDNEVINAKGQLLKEKSDESPFVSDKGDYVIYSKNGIEYYIDYTGNISKSKIIPDGSTYVSEGFATDKNNNFVNIKKGIINTKKYSVVKEFHNSVALVGITDEFGNIKYGFIDTNGKEIINPVFTVQPHDFNSERAKVYPRTVSDFKYAFINKSGKVVFSQSQADINKYGEFDNFKYDYSFSLLGKFVADTSGKIITTKDFFSQYGLSENDYFENFEKINTYSEKGPSIVYSARIKKIDGVEKTKFLKFAGYNRFGVINLNSKKMVSPIFYYNPTKPDCLFFDPFSKLAYAEKYVGNDTNGNEIWRKGYINEEGIFVIVLQDAPTW